MRLVETHNPGTYNDTMTNAYPRGMSGELTNWAVMWVAVTDDGPTVIEKWCGTDFSEAQRIFALAVRAEKRHATLRCANVSFPPPKKYRSKMNEVNLRGVFWCPYCIQMRRFQKQDGFMHDDIFIPRESYYCPVCGISCHNGSERRYNPKAVVISEPKRRVRRSNKQRGKRTKRRRRSRSTR
jgi:hypothetical protein